MQIVSGSQHRASRAGQIPRAEELHEGTWAVPLGLPGAFPGGSQPYSLGYVLDDGGGALHVLDPGWQLDGNLRTWEEFFTSIGRGFDDVASVTMTHLHYDHMGLAQGFADRSGAVVIAHDLEAEAIEGAARAEAKGDLSGASESRRAYTEMTPARIEEFGVPKDRREEVLSTPEPVTLATIDRRVTDGQRLPIDGRNLIVVATPGHTGGHMCLVEQESNLLFSGDHVLPGINSGVGLGGRSPGNPLADYFESLERIRTFDDLTIAPGHEYAFRGIAARAEALRAHHLRRTRQVAEVMDSVTTVWDIATKVTWSAGFERLRGYTLASALSQVAIHMDYARTVGV